MVRSRGGRVKWWRRRGKTTVVLGCLNLFALLYVVRSLYASLYVLSSADSVAFASSDFGSFPEFKFSEDQIERMEASIRIRAAAIPSELVRLVNGLKQRVSRKRRDSGLSPPEKQKLADEILQMLKALDPYAYVTEQREALERWRMAKLESVKRANEASGSEGEMEKALEGNWHLVLEEIGISMPAEVKNEEVNEKPLAVPPKCHAETHTEYEGLAVNHGSTLLKDSAVDCCQACIDQSTGAADGEPRCNIWVYCPAVEGCFSIEVNKHEHRKCLLLRAERPRVRLKDTYSEEYRDSHPSAPLIVPWISEHWKEADHHLLKEASKCGPSQ